MELTRLTTYFLDEILFKLAFSDPLFPQKDDPLSQKSLKNKSMGDVY